MDGWKCPGFIPVTPEIQCPMRETCWRFKAPDTPGWQAYMHAPLYQLSGGGGWKCDEYWKVDRDTPA